MKILLYFLPFCLLLSCSKSGNTPSTKIPDPLTVNCIPGSPGCSEMQVQGDSYYILPNNTPSPFSGYADPTIRKDPASNTFWLAYSWPNYHFFNGNEVPGVDIHLAKSTDGGNSFSFVTNLWPSTSATNPVNGDAGYLDHEVANLLPVVENNITTWYGVRLDYFIPNAGGYEARPSTSFQIRVYKAGSPEGLNAATSYTSLGTYFTAPGWNTENLSSLNAELTNVGFWNEPSLYYEDGKLYLVLVAFVYDSNGIPVISQNNVYVFSTIPTGDPVDWNWGYNGKLSGAPEAGELGAQVLTQVDIVKGVDGKLLMVASLSDWNSALNDFTHKGCKVIEIKSLLTPALERDGNGKLKVRAVITTSDANALGSGASSYDPGADCGILFTRRNKTSSELTVRIWKTGIKP
jgi:hypothetical protein